MVATLPLSNFSALQGADLIAYSRIDASLRVCHFTVFGRSVSQITFPDR